MNDHRQCSHVGNTAQHCRLGLLQDSVMLETLKIVNLPRVSLVYLWKSNICSRKWNVQETNVGISHFERTEVFSLDVGLSMDGLFALDLSDVVMEVLHSLKNAHTHQAQGDLVREDVRRTNPNTNFSPTHPPSLTPKKATEML